MSSLHCRLKDMINDLGLTRDEFAALCEISKSQLYRYLNGEQKPGASFLQNLQSKFPDVDMNWLMTGVKFDIEAVASMVEQGLSFEEHIAELIVWETMQRSNHYLDDAERNNLVEFIANNKIGDLLESVTKHVLLFKKVRADANENRQAELKKNLLKLEVDRINKQIAQKKIEEQRHLGKKGN